MPPSPAEDDSAAAADPTLLDLFVAFSGVAIMGFGGVMPFARRMLVDERRWMTPDRFNEAIALAQFLPGGNILNLSVIVGQRFRGAAGSVVAVAGLLAGPVVIVSLLGLAYFRYGESEAVHGALAGVAAAAAGLLLAMAAKMAEPLVRRRAAVPLVVAALAFVGIGLAGLPLALVLAMLVPISVAIAWRRP
jgi:chromate transporter